MDIANLSPIGQINYKKMTEGKQVYDYFQELTKNPMEINKNLLMKILQDNKDTEYGKKNGFDQIQSVEDYQKKVPLSSYDDYAEYIERMTENDEKNLITAYDVIHYSKSSGTMGNPKRIPFTDRMAEVATMFNDGYRGGVLGTVFTPEDMDGRAIGLMEAHLSTLKNGVTYGAFSAKSIMDYKDYLQFMFTSPSEAIIADTSTNTRYLHALFALQDPDIVEASTAFHSFFLEILRYIEKNWKVLVKDIEQGTIDDSIQMTDEVRASLLKKIQPMPERAAFLRGIFQEGFDEPFVKKVWPKFALLSGVGTGGFSKYTDKIREHYVGNDFRCYLNGLQASEGLLSIPVEIDNPNFAFLPISMFYEFLPLDAEPLPENCLTLEQVEIGKEYELVVTNLGGFYRYRMNDAIRITGKYNEMPTMEFLYRINQTVSIMGEKTSEIALTATAEKTAKEMGFDLIEYCLYPDLDNVPVRYVFYMEIEGLKPGITKADIRNQIEKNLAIMNPSMGDKVASGICGATELHIMQPESFLLYKDIMVAKGASSAQIKPVRVINNAYQSRFFAHLIEEDYE